jgi:hypothetical protein
VHIQDNVCVGPPSLSLRGSNQASPYGLTGGDDPTQQLGVGPMATCYTWTITPATKAVANLAALQAQAAGAGLALAAGAGVTLDAGLAPDGSGRTVYRFDVPRCVSLTTGGGNNLSGSNFTITGFDQYAKLQTQKIAGPNNTTVNTKKAFLSVLSITSDTTSALTVSAGTADIFGLPLRCPDASYIVSVKGNNALAQDAGTLVAADATTPATNATGDPRGTYAPSFASSGAAKLTISQFLDPTQIGPIQSASTLVNVLGVTPV